MVRPLSGRRWWAAGLLIGGAVVAAWGVVSLLPREPVLRGLGTGPQPPLEALGGEDRKLVEAKLEALREVLSRDASAAGPAFGELGQLYLALDFLPGARWALFQATRLDPENPDWPYYLAVVHQLEGDAEAAAALLAEWIERFGPENAALLRLTELLLLLGRAEEAGVQAAKVLEVAPEHAVAHYLLGLVAAERGEDRRAVEHFRRALHSQPAATSLHYPLALAWGRLGDEEARDRELAAVGEGRVQLDDPRLARTIALRQSAEAHLIRGGFLVQQGRVAEAEAAYRSAARLAPESAEPWLALAAVLGETGRTAAAIAAVEEAERRDEESARAPAVRGLIEQRAGHPREALVHLERALERQPGDRRLLRQRGMLLAELDRCAEAEPVLTRALDDDPFSTPVRVQLAVCRNRGGNDVDALAAIRRGLEISPADAVLRAAAIRLCASSSDPAVRDPGLALTEAETLAAEARTADAVEVLAMASAAAGIFDDAVRLQEEAIERSRELEYRTDLLPALEENLERYRRRLPSPWAWPPPSAGQGQGSAEQGPAGG